ncbi:MAG: hypothetical protein D4R77_07230 [Planctomycetaceae bacterium]|nr:MAG: hypothetical protein D4R77_07230 [Planctomycetaceae bacterium]
MSKRYYADSAVQTAIAEVLEFYGLEPFTAAACRKPAVASTIGEQFQRLAVANKVVADVRRLVAIDEADRRLIYQLVDSACQRIEQAERPATCARYLDVPESSLIAYACAGGGRFGSYAKFRRTWISSAEPIKDFNRQDAPPPPMQNPARGPSLPPARPSTNPSRPVRSSRWNGKEVQS